MSMRTPEVPVPAKLFLCILPIVQIAIGSVYLNECPLQPYIPIYLIVMGVFCLVLALFSFLPCDPDGACKWWYSLMINLIFWGFISGNVCIYLIYEPNYGNKNMTHVEPYCNKTLYLFAFWTTNLVYILLGLLLFALCCVVLVNKISTCLP